MLSKIKDDIVRHYYVRMISKDMKLDEEIIIGYKTNRFEYQDVEKQQLWGKDTYAVSFFYVEYHESISRFDKLVEPIIDAEGNIVTPVKENLKHNIHMAERFRADAGRTEFWRLACTSE